MQRQKVGVSGGDDTSGNKLVFDALTGLRAVAAYLVFIHHTPVRSLYIPGWDIQSELHIGVPIFFVLSGFLISYRYFNNIVYSHTWFIQYFQNRFARIFPVYFIICISIYLLGQYRGMDNALLNITLLHGFFSDIPRTIEQSWSLTVEECFYFSAPFIFYFGRRWLWPPWLFFLLLLPVVLHLHQWLGLQTSFLQGHKFVLLYTFFGRFTEFFCGIALGRFVLANHHRLQHRRHGVLFTSIGVIGIVLCCIAMAQVRTPQFNTGLKTIPGMVVNNLLFPCFVVALIYGLIYERTLLRRMLSAPLAILLGKSSYVFYLVHRGLFFDIICDQTVGWPLAYIFNFMFINLVAIVLYRFVEHPLNDKIRKITWQRKKLHTGF